MNILLALSGFKAEAYFINASTSTQTALTSLAECPGSISGVDKSMPFEKDFFIHRRAMREEVAVCFVMHQGIQFGCEINCSPPGNSLRYTAKSSTFGQKYLISGKLLKRQTLFQATDFVMYLYS